MPVVLALLCAAQFMVVLDVSVVNVALPSIQHALGFDARHLAWVGNAYALSFGALLLLGGRLADLYGHRRVFAADLTVFTAASLAKRAGRRAGRADHGPGLSGGGGGGAGPGHAHDLDRCLSRGAAPHPRDRDLDGGEPGRAARRAT
ncbi:MFS transporter [Nonomuraea ferruginea]